MLYFPNPVFCFMDDISMDCHTADNHSFYLNVSISALDKK